MNIETFGTPGASEQHWMKVSNSGWTSSETPDSFLQKATEYFKWCDDNPIKSKRTLTSGKTQGAKVEMEFVRPYTIKGLCIHCNIPEKFLIDISKTYNPEERWRIVVEKVLMIIYNQNLEGGIVDMYNPVIISKILNLEKPEDNRNVSIRVEVIKSDSEQLANSENQVLQMLDSEKVHNLEKAAEIYKDKSADRNPGMSDSGF